MRYPFAAMVASVIFIGGIVLLLYVKGFWGYILGIPAVQIGIIFIIISFEKLSRDTADEDIEHQKAELRRIHG